MGGFNRGASADAFVRENGLGKDPWAQVKVIAQEACREHGLSPFDYEL